MTFLGGMGIWLALCLVFIRFSWLDLVGALGCPWFASQVWREFDPRKKAGGDEEDKPIVSLVLLLREPRYLEAAILAQVVSRVWGGAYGATSAEEEVPKPEPEDASSGNLRWVAGSSPMFMVKSPEGFFLVHNHDRPYFEDPKGAAAAAGEGRVRHALEENRAWISVDLVRPFEPSRPPESFYPQIGRLVAGLAGPDCSALFHPASGRIAPWDESLEGRLAGPDPLQAFAEPVHPPVISVDGDDPRMAAAVAEARRRWPEFVGAFKRRDGECFSVKAPVAAGGNTEFIWINVVGFEPEYIHGTLGNDPVNLGSLKSGDRVEVPLKDMNDWCFVRNGQPVGMFTARVIAEIHKERKGG